MDVANILIIDDDPAVRSTLQKVLQRAGHRVEVADDGKGGLEMARERRPDLVVTDLIMPEVEGMETIQILRREFPGLKILAISGGGSMGPGAYLNDAQVLGADRAMAKPFTPAELVYAVETLLGEEEEKGA